jgi:hypothetical protein
MKLEIKITGSLPQEAMTNYLLQVQQKICTACTCSNRMEIEREDEEKGIRPGRGALLAGCRFSLFGAEPRA